MFAKNVRRALACASLIAVAAGSAPASAQQIDRIVAFGDSYADIGNALRLAGVNPISTQVYTTGRFSGGTNYIDTLSTILGAPQFNFAIGGARTNNGNQTAGLPGFTFEAAQFNAGGGALGFPVVDTTLTRNDLVAVSIGGNDARAYQQGGGTVAGASAAAATAAASAQANLDIILSHGPATVSFLAGDTGQLPEIAGNPAGAQVRTAFSTAFNSDIQNVLAGYAQQGSIVHYLELTAMLNDVKANPAAYGITNGLTCPAFPNTTCVVNPSGYLFYGDLLHLTSDGFAIVAQYVAKQLAAPLTLQAPSDLAFDTARQFGRTLSTRSDLYGRGPVTPGLKLFAVGDFFSRDVPISSDNASFDIDGVGGTIGAEYGLPMGAVGIAGNYSRPRVRFGNDSARINARSWQIGAYGSLSSGGLFGQAYLGYGWDKHKITRTGVVENMNANPSGNHWLAGAKGGYLMPFGPAKIGPVIALDYAKAKVDGYTETGDPALNLNVGSQSLKAMLGQAGLEVRADFTGIRPYLDVTAEHDFTGNGRVISFAQTSAPTIVNRWSVSRDKDTYGRVQFGAAADLWSGMSLDAAVTTTFARDGGRDTGAHVGVRANF